VNGELYARSLQRGDRLHAVYPDGRRQRVPVHEWRRPELPGDASVLDRCVGPTLDVGCGPGRLAAALVSRGRQVLAIDVEPAAVRLARAAGAPALTRSVFDSLPGAGTWGTALLCDGNVGIGGDPVRLFGRLREVLRPGGRVLVEVSPAEEGSAAFRLRLTSGPRVGEQFPWARVAAPDVCQVAAAAGLTVVETWTEAGRWFGSLGSG
jgi:SAM-dependent methyltransferase